MNNNFVAIQDLELGNAVVVGYNDFSVSIDGSDLVLTDCFKRPFVKFPFDLGQRFREVHGLPEGVGFDENGNLEVFEIDYDDEDYFGEEEQSKETLERYSHISSHNFTLIILNK